MPKKLDDCVKKLIAQGKTEKEAYAICINSTGIKPKKGGGWTAGKTSFKEYLEQKNLNEYSKVPLSHLISLRAIPLSEPMMDRLGYSYETEAYHLTNIRHLEGLVKIQKTKKQISTFSRGGPELARLPSQPDILLKLQGTAVVDGHSDIWTLVDTSGRRWIDQSNRVQNNKMTFRINGILQKLLDTPDDVAKMKAAEIEKIINNMNNKEKSNLYKDYINAVEKYIDSGGYKDLSDYLKKVSPGLTYNEIILSTFKIISVQTVDISSASTLGEISSLGLIYDGEFSSRDFKKLKI